MTRQQWDTTKRGTWFALGVLSTAFAMWWTMTPPSVTPEAARNGLAAEWQSISEPIAASVPQFQLVNADGAPIVQDNTKANVRWWEVWQKIGANTPPNYPQQVGDCTGFGAKNGIEQKQGIDLARGADFAFRPIDPCYLYGYSRVQIGKGKVRGDGSVGAWVALAAKEGGLLFLDDPGVPPYSGARSRQWGQSGPPAEFIAIAKQRRVKTIAPVKTAAQCRDAICNGYPVTIASQFGSTDIRPRDGRMVARRNTQWAHQMCCIGYDGSAATAYFYILNSWGEGAHVEPLQGEPRGGFWVTFDDMQWICSTGDCWSLSDLDGFPAQRLDIDVFASTVSLSR
jgi:hypothetical protein